MRPAAVAAGGCAAGGALAAAAVALLVPLLALLPGLGTAPASAPASVSGPAGAVEGIPAAYLDAFGRASARYGIPWTVLAGIYRVECDFGQSRLAGCPRGTANALGAQGPGQFLPTTWRQSLRPGTIIPLGPPAPDGTGYATDGDGDGVADPWDPYDATAATARLLAADGGASDISRAVFGYNHDPQYVANVLALAASYAGGASPGGAAAVAVPAQGPEVGAGVPPGRVAAVLGFARAQLGLPYRWGGSGPAAWDCSGLVQAASRRVGLLLTHDAAAQYAATASMAVPLMTLRPGDLVFYGRSPATIHHVGIVVDPTHMIDAPYTGADVRVDPVAAADLLVATRPFG